MQAGRAWRPWRRRGKAPIPWSKRSKTRSGSARSQRWRSPSAWDSCSAQAGGARRTTLLPGVRDLKERLDAAMKTGAWSTVAGVAALVMLGFLCAALFLYLQNWRGSIVACLILAGAFLLVVPIAAIALVRRRQAQLARARAQANQAAGQWLRDPVVVTTALQVARALGLRRAAPVLLLGAFVVGLVLSRTAAKAGHPAGPES